MAPIQGVTDFIYRNTFPEFFDGFDLAVAPFIATSAGNRAKKSRIRDILPALNTGLPVIPQILSKDPDDFIALARQLFDLGYEKVNWNLGCPFPMVTRKLRGSGLLPFPEKIDAFLEAILLEIPNKLSIKTRLGLEKTDEIESTCTGCCFRRRRLLGCHRVGRWRGHLRQPGFHTGG